MKLSPEQIAQFEEQGFLKVPGFLTIEEVDALKNEMNRLVEEFCSLSREEQTQSTFSTTDPIQKRNKFFLESGDKIRFFLEDIPECTNQSHQKHSINKVGHALHELNPVFRQLTDSVKVRELVYSLGFKKPQALQSMYIFKQPRIGGAVVPHRDNTFLYTEPLSTIGLWLAIDEAAAENGCLFAVPGSHREKLKSRFCRDEQGQSTYFDNDDDYEPLKAENGVPLEAERGTLVIINGSVNHYSFANTSEQSRHAYTMHLIEAQGTTYSPRNWLQRTDGKEFYNVLRP